MLHNSPRRPQGIEARVTRLSGSGTTEYILPLEGCGSLTFQNLVLGEGDVAFGTNGGKVVSFEVGSGTVRWTWQAPSGEAELVAATGGNGLVVKDGGRSVRLDAMGQATYDDCIEGPTAPIDASTISHLQYAWGRQWLALHNSPNPGTHPVAISAAAILWPDSDWARAGQDLKRASTGEIPLFVAKLVHHTDVVIEDGFVRSRVNTGISFWRLAAGIRIRWDGTIHPADACYQRESCSGSDENRKYDLTDFKEGVPVSYIRSQFPMQLVGTQVLFVGSIFTDINVYGLTPKELRNSKGFTNFTVIRGSGEYLLVFAHELGHVLALEHVLERDNLMCGSVGISWSPWPIPWLCDPNSEKLTNEQIRNAQRDARGLEE